MAARGRLRKRTGERPVVNRIRRVVAVDAFGDVAGHDLHREAARLLTEITSTHSVGDHDEERKPLRVGGQAADVRKSRVVHLDLLLELADQEVVLIIGAHFPRMRESVDVDLGVEWLAGDGLGVAHALKMGFGPAAREPVPRIDRAQAGLLPP